MSKRHASKNVIESPDCTKISAPKVKEMLMQIAKDYGLDFEKDFVGLGSDGAPLMLKSGRLLGAKKGKLIHMICLAHGLHLAVCDILYKKKATEEDAGDDDDDDDTIDEPVESSDDEDDDENENQGKNYVKTFVLCGDSEIVHIS